MAGSVVARRPAELPQERVRRGPTRWAEWARMLAEGVYASRAELARGEDVSRAAVTLGLGKLRGG